MIAWKPTRCAVALVLYHFLTVDALGQTHLSAADQEYHKSLMTWAMRCDAEDFVTYSWAMKNAPGFVARTAAKDLEITKRVYRPFVLRSVTVLGLDRQKVAADFRSQLDQVLSESEVNPRSDDWRKCSPQRKKFFYCNSWEIDGNEKAEAGCNTKQ